MEFGGGGALGNHLLGRLKRWGKITFDINGIQS
jgi:hypothetical protein